MKRRSAIRNLIFAGAVSFFASPSSARAGDDPGNFARHRRDSLGAPGRV